MTSPLDQKKIKIAGPVVVTANRVDDGAEGGALAVAAAQDYPNPRSRRPRAQPERP